MWNAELYEKYSMERLQPSLDLTARLDGDPFAILDVGCGSGMSTMCLRQRFPYAKIKGVDLSDQMLEKARSLQINADFFQKDCSRDLESMGRFDLVFSNAFLQWLDDQEAFIRDIRLNMHPGAILALQIPLFGLNPMCKIIFDTAEDLFGDKTKDVHLYHDYSVPEYYDMFNQYYGEVDLWKTTYFYHLENSESIVEFLQGTALIPFREALDEEDYSRFVTALKARAIEVYPAAANGKVLFPFERLFIIAKKA